MASYNDELNEFAKAVTELRYLAIAAKYFNNLKNDGVPAIMSEIGEQVDKVMSVIELIEPNLLRKIGLENIVDKTVFVGTHFCSLIDTATELPNAGNLKCVSREENGELVYTYKIQLGFSTNSNGTYLARKMGADREGLKKILAERVEKDGLTLRQ